MGLVMSLVHSSDLLRTAGEAAYNAARVIDSVRLNEPILPLDDLRLAEARLVQALTEVRAAAWGVRRRNPAFDAGDLALLLDKEAAAVRSASGYIPVAS